MRFQYIFLPPERELNEFRSDWQHHEFHFDFISIFFRAFVVTSSECYWIGMKILLLKSLCVSIDANGSIMLTLKRMEFLNGRQSFLGDHAYIHWNLSCSCRYSNLLMQNECLSLSIASILYFVHSTSDMNSMLSCFIIRIRKHYFLLFLFALSTCCVSVVVICGCKNNKATQVINCRELLLCRSAMHV